MKKLIYLFIFFLPALLLTSCEEDEPEAITKSLVSSLKIDFDPVITYTYYSDGQLKKRCQDGECSTWTWTQNQLVVEWENGGTDTFQRNAEGYVVSGLAGQLYTYDSSWNLLTAETNGRMELTWQNGDMSKRESVNNDTVYSTQDILYTEKLNLCDFGLRFFPAENLANSAFVYGLSKHLPTSMTGFGYGGISFPTVTFVHEFDSKDRVTKARITYDSDETVYIFTYKD